MTKTTDVLVLGGGFAGTTLAQELSQAGFSVTLVDRKDYFEVTFAMLRNVADFATLKNQPRAKYADFLQGDFVHAGVTALSTEAATLDNGETIGFSTAIIATGSSYASMPIAKSVTALTYEARHDEVQTAAETLAAAKSVLIIGGGVVGVELAGDVAYSHPHIKVTLADAGDTILSAYSEKAQRKATEQLNALGVTIQTNRRYMPHEDGYKDAASGEEISADLTYMAVGVKPNSAFMQPQLSHTLTERGLIQVDTFYRVKGTDNLYALGDVADLPDLKLGALAQTQAQTLAANLIKARKGKSLKAHKPGPTMGIIPIGQEKGVAQLPFGTVTWKFIIDMKNKDLFIGRMMKDMGAR
ncbi:MAG: FAD-dependent oxidoreductase [Bacteroidota bacterium]